MTESVPVVIRIPYHKSHHTDSVQIYTSLHGRSTTVEKNHSEESQVSKVTLSSKCLKWNQCHCVQCTLIETSVHRGPNFIPNPTCIRIAFNRVSFINCTLRRVSTLMSLYTKLTIDQCHIQKPEASVMELYQ